MVIYTYNNWLQIPILHSKSLCFCAEETSQNHHFLAKSKKNGMEFWHCGEPHRIPIFRENPWIFHGFSCSFPAFPTFSPRSQRRKFGIRIPGGRKSRAKGSKAADANAAHATARSARSQAILRLRKKASFFG